ncbi:unnamed protein product, partial [Urochloa humidicola]
NGGRGRGARWPGGRRGQAVAGVREAQQLWVWQRRDIQRQLGLRRREASRSWRRYKQAAAGGISRPIRHVSPHPSRRWETPTRCRCAPDPVTGSRIRTRDEVDLGAAMASRAGPPSRNISSSPHPHHTDRPRRRSRRSDGGGAPGGGKGGEVAAPVLAPASPPPTPRATAPARSPRQAAASNTGDSARRGAAVQSCGGFNQHRRQRRLGHTTAGAPR